MATHLNILAWKIPWVRGFFVALMGYNAWGHKESDTTGHAHTPSKMTGVFMKRGEDGDIRGEGGHVVMEADWSGVSTSQGMSRTTGKLQELVGRTLLYRSQIDLNSVDPCQTCSLQNCGTMNFCCFQPLRLWHFVTGKLVHQYPIFVKCPQAGVILISSLNLS